LPQIDPRRLYIPAKSGTDSPHSRWLIRRFDTIAAASQSEASGAATAHFTHTDIQGDYWCTPAKIAAYGDEG
jgi:hypothetical protein